MLPQMEHPEYRVPQMPIVSFVSGKFKKQTNAESETNVEKKTLFNWLKEKTIRKLKYKIRYKLIKLNFMTSYKKLVKTFDYSIVIDNEVIGKYKGNYTYGQNKTFFDSYIEVEFIPYATIMEIPNIIISDNYFVTLKENADAKATEQINYLFTRLISQIIVNVKDYDVQHKKKTNSI
jgi:hypothetical protein